MSINTRPVYLPQTCQRRTDAASAARFLCHFVKITVAIITYMLYRLNDYVRSGRMGYQHVIHIPVSYENQGECACGPA